MLLLFKERHRTHATLQDLEVFLSEGRAKQALETFDLDKDGKARPMDGVTNVLKTWRLGSSCKAVVLPDDNDATSLQMCPAAQHHRANIYQP